MFRLLIVLLLLCYMCVEALADFQTFGQCIKQTPSPGVISCAGVQALNSLQTIENAENFTIASGLVMTKDESSVMSRSIPNFLEQDPMDFRGILENAGALVGQRQLQWDMGMIYPGLSMRIGPSLGTNGMLEFILDPTNSRDDRTYLSEEPSTARILAKQFLVPFLLGLKFNLATLIPLVFAGLILLSKKALFLGKIALFLTSVFGYGSILSVGGIGGGGGGGFGGGFGGGGFGGGGFGHGGYDDYDHHHHHHHKPHFGGGGSFGGNHYGYLPHEFYKNDNHDGTVYQKPAEVTENIPLLDKFYDYEKQYLLQDKLFERNSQTPRKSERTSNRDEFRSFAWKTV